MSPTIQNLLKWLICPKCQGSFLSELDTLICQSCNKSYPIKNGIPRFSTENDSTHSYVQNFQFYWKNLNWRRDKLNQEQFAKLSDYKPGDLDGKLVLDAGCGGGRWTSVMASLGATVIGIELTNAIDTAYENTKDLENVFLVQGDIFELPFRSGIFDTVFCFAVLMTLPEPKKAFKQLARVTKLKGNIHLLLYRRVTALQKWLDDRICSVTKRLPIKLAFLLSSIPTAIEYLPFSTLLFGNLFYLSGQSDWTLKKMHNFDWYTCRYRWRHSAKEIQGWYRDQGFESIAITDTNQFRKASNYSFISRFKTWALDNNLFLKATLGVRGMKAREII